MCVDDTKIQLRFRGDYASGLCPLPTHKPGDKSRSFSVNVKQNYWRCFSDSCNQANGGKRGGDCINLVAAMEGCKEKKAAQKLADWFKVGESSNSLTQARKATGSNGSGVPVVSSESLTKTKPPTHIEQGENQQQRTTSQPSTPPDTVKVGYMQAVGLWFDTFIVRRPDEPDADYLKRIKKGVMTQLHQSFLNGKKGQQELPVV